MKKSWETDQYFNNPLLPLMRQYLIGKYVFYLDGPLHNCQEFAYQNSNTVHVLTMEYFLYFRKATVV